MGVLRSVERAAAEAIRRVYVEHARESFPSYKAMAERMVADLNEIGITFTEAGGSERADPSPGDFGRFALHVDAGMFVIQLGRWCDSAAELTRVTDWFEAVYLGLRERETA